MKLFVFLDNTYKISSNIFYQIFGMDSMNNAVSLY